MAKRRMFSMKIVDTDEFLDMPLSTQSLYFHLGMRADDEGFVGNVSRIMRMINSSIDDLKILLGKKFVIQFESGICVIKHWKINNYLQKDRIEKTTYLKEKEQLFLKENGTYTLQDNEMYTKCIHSIDKTRLDNKLVKYNNNIFTNYETAGQSERANIRSEEEREEYIKYFKNFFDCCYGDNFRDIAYEIIDTMIEALEQSSTENGLRFNGETYHLKELSKMLLISNTKFSNLVQQITLSENIKSRPLYILGCLIKKE